MIHRSLSTTSSQEEHDDTTTTPTPASTVANLRKYIKPFLLQCHPDVQTAPDAKHMNLMAVQTLNAYLDSMEAVASGKKLSKVSSPTKSKENEDDNEGTSTTNDGGIEIDFIIMVEDHRKGLKKPTVGKHRPTASRRRVQLTWPDSDAPDRPAYLIHHVSVQLVKLLRVAGLDVPIPLRQMEAHVPTEEDDDVHARNRYMAKHSNSSTTTTTTTRMNQDDVWAHVMDMDDETRKLVRDLDGYRTETKSFYARREMERRRFTNSIDWEKFDVLYQKAWAKFQADVATRGLVQHNRNQRRNFIAEILARVTCDTNIPIVDRFCAMRRLSMVFEQHFDRLELEDSGAFWDKVTIYMTGPREYNTSPSAMHKRRLKQADEGFVFALQANGKVSLQIPIDYREDELLQQWDRNLGDFHAFMGDEFDDIFLTN
jgi:hypothetical protein